MYKSPINVIYGKLQTKIEGEIMKAVQNVEVDVDKEELLRALQYDRGQYDKGYRDGEAAAMPKWIPVTERMPAVRQRVLVYCESKTIKKHVTACTYMGGYLGAEQFSRHVRNVTHWMPLPEPPKEVER